MSLVTSLTHCILLSLVLLRTPGMTAARIQPEVPVRVIVLSPSGTPTEPIPGTTKVPYRYIYKIENTSAQDAMVYAIRWVWEDAEGNTISKGAYTYRWSFDPDTPVLRAGETKTDSYRGLARGPILRAEIDSVLLRDGAIYGTDNSQTLKQFRYMLSATRMAQRQILSLLESKGIEEVKMILRKQLSNEAQEKRYYRSGNPRVK